MYDYLVAHPEADPTGLLRAQGVGGPVPMSGCVPVGIRARSAYRGLRRARHCGAARARTSASCNAKFLTFFVDLVYDADPDFTMKNQLFFDSMDQSKISNQPSGLKQKVRVMEEQVHAHEAPNQPAVVARG